MAKMIRAVDGTVSAGIHMITFVADEETFVPDVPEIIEQCRMMGAALVKEEAAEAPVAKTAEGEGAGEGEAAATKTPATKAPAKAAAK